MFIRTQQDAAKPSVSGDQTVHCNHSELNCRFFTVRAEGTPQILTISGTNKNERGESNHFNVNFPFSNHLSICFGYTYLFHTITSFKVINQSIYLFSNFENVWHGIFVNQSNNCLEILEFVLIGFYWVSSYYTWISLEIILFWLLIQLKSFSSPPLSILS